MNLFENLQKLKEYNIDDNGIDTDVFNPGSEDYNDKLTASKQLSFYDDNIKEKPHKKQYVIFANGTLDKNCRGFYRTHTGGKWCYERDAEKFWEDELKRYASSGGKYIWKSKEVLQNNYK